MRERCGGRYSERNCWKEMEREQRMGKRRREKASEREKKLVRKMVR